MRIRLGVNNMAKLLSGKEVAASLNESIRERDEALRARGITPKLAIVRCGENPSDLAYERGAAKRAEVCGIEIENVLYPEGVTKEELISGIEQLNGDDSIHGVLLFRPLPRALRKYESEIANHLLPEKDVDCMTDLSHAGVYTGKNIGYPPCTPEACMKILDHYDIDLKGKNVVIIGRSLVVGKPVTMMLMGKNATVTVCHRQTVDVPGIASRADIIVSAAGELNFLTKDYVRPGQIVIDVSINWDPDKKDGKGGVVGDAVFEQVEPIVDAITPVPGGVGTVTTSVLMEHVVRAAEWFR